MEMSTVPGSWELASLVCKFLFYLGAASAFGGSLSLWFYGDGSRATVQRVLFYQLLTAFLGFQAVVINFLVQVGLINNSGIAGAFDWGMAEILLQTQLGDLSLYRLVGFTVMIGTSLFFFLSCRDLRSAPDSNFYRRNIFGNTVGFLLLALSFRFGGHVSVLHPAVQFVLVIHFAAFAYWIGALYPLYLVSASDNIENLKLALKKFGEHAMGVVLALVVAGVILAFNLLHSVMELIETPYGRTLFLKQLLVVALLAIAALNKLVLVPGLIAQGNAENFRKSVRVEVVVASLLLAVTAYLSTVVGPMSHDM